MGSNANRITSERCLEAYNLAPDKDNYDLIEIKQKEVGKPEKRIRFYLVVKCKVCGNIFESEFYNWVSGKRCKRCACRAINKDKAYTTDDAIKICNDRGYIYVEGECINNRSRIIVEDSNGYRYNPRLYDVIRRNGVLSPFISSNPFTIYNINKYCENNNTSTRLLSDKYISNNSRMVWVCGVCGKSFEKDWAKFSFDKSFYCKECSSIISSEKQKIPIGEVKDLFINNGLTPLFEEYRGNDQKLTCVDKDGYFGYISYASLQIGNKPRRYGKENVYTNKNILKYCKDNEISTTLEDDYTNNSKKMKWRCGKCGEIYLATWASFKSKSYHYCSECSNRKEIKKEKEAFDFNKVKQVAIDNNYEILSKYIPKTSAGKIVYRDSIGYLYFTRCSTILRGCISCQVHPNNPYSIRNIRKFINDNKINAELLTVEYKTSGANNLELVCSCGKTFKISWSNLQTRKTEKCIDCRKADTLESIRRIDWRHVVEDETGYEYKLLRIKYPVEKNKEVRLIVRHKECNRTYEVSGYSFKNGTRCKTCVMKKMGENKRDTIEEFIKYVDTETNGEYTCLSDTYDLANTPVKMRHNMCGHEYMVSPNSFKNGGDNGRGNRCPRCASLRSVSYTHAILSLLFERYFIGVEFEYDAGFRTKKNGVSKYDLYVEPLNLLIEWQSEYHDCKKQKIIDSQKAEYALSNGYEFLALDHRSFKTIDYVKMFFPFLDKIPNDLDLEVFEKFNVVKAQMLLDSGKSIKQAAKDMKASTSMFYNAIKRGDIYYPSNYFDKHKQNREVVQLTLDGEFVCEYISIAEAKRVTGFMSINEVCLGSLNNSGGYFWVYKDKYIIGNYCIPDKNNCIVYGRPLVQLDMSGKFIDKYESQKDAMDKTGINLSSISAGMRNSNGYCKGYVWVYLDDYESKNYVLPPKRRTEFTIVKLTLDFEYICEYDNLKDIVDKCGFARSNISKAISNSRTSHGFRWMYKDDYEKYIENNNK